MEAFLTPSDFVFKAEAFWGKQYAEEARQLIEEKLRRFGHDELARIFDRIAETSKYLPRLKDIFGVAEDLQCGLKNQQPQRVYEPLAFPRTDCPLCRGDGLLYVYFRIYPATGDKQLVRTAPQGRRWFDHPPAVYEFVYRCSCEAGERMEPFASRFPQFHEWSCPAKPLDSHVSMPAEEAFAGLPF